MRAALLLAVLLLAGCASPPGPPDATRTPAQLREDGSLRIEAFPGPAPDKVAGFTEAARVYVR